jgi:hypothetical protein
MEFPIKPGIPWMGRTGGLLFCFAAMKLTHFALVGLILLIAAGIYLTLQTDMDGKVAQLQADFDRENQRRDRELKETIARTGAEAKAAADKAREMAVAADGAGDPDAPAAPQNPPADPAVANALDKVRSAVTPGPPPLDLEPAPQPPAPGITTEILEKEDDVINSTRAEAERIARETAELNNAAVDTPLDKLSNLQSLIMAQPRIARVSDARPADNTDFIVLDEGSNKGLMPGDRFAIRRGTAIIARIVVGDTVRETQCVANVVPRSLVTGIIIRPGDEVIKFDR